MARVNKLYEKPLVTSIGLSDKVTVGELVNGEYKVKTMLYSVFLSQIIDDTLVLVVTRAQLQALISGSGLGIGVRYIITNAVASTLSLLIQAVSTTVLNEIAVNTADGENYKYNIVSDTAILISTPIALGTSNQVLGVNNGATGQEYKTVQGTANRVSVNHTANTITLTTPQDIATTSDVEFGKLKLNNIIPLEDEFAIIGQAVNDSIGTIDNAYFISSLDLLTNAVADSTYLTSIEGIAAGGELEGNYASPTLKNSSVIGKVLTGLSVTGSAVVSTDSVLAAIGKLQNQVNGLAGGVEYQGTWNASTNTPTLTSSVGTQGFYYVVSVAGTTNLNGITTWELGDWAIFNGTTYQKVDNTDAVVSVNGYTGIVTLSAADVSAVPTSSISGTSGTVALFGASNTLGNSIITQSGTSVGIGTATPETNLQIVGNTFSIIRATSTSGVQGIDFGLVGDSDAGRLRYNPTTHTISLFADNAERLSLTSTELITFGATDTGEAHIFGGSARVNGNTYLNGTTTPLTIDSSTGYTSLKIDNQTINAAYRNWAITNSGNNAGDLSFFVSSAQGGNPITGTIPLNIASSGAATFSSSVTIGNKTTTEINALTPATGMTVFNTTLGTLCFYDGAAWKKVTHSAM